MGKEQYICPCRHVTKEDIEKAVYTGARRFRDVKEMTKVGTGCGKCKKQAKKYFHYLLESQGIVVEKHKDKEKKKDHHKKS